MSVFMLSKGESIEILCPAHYANGGAAVYAHFDHEQIPPNTDLKYKISVLECEPDLAVLNKLNMQYKLEPLKARTEKDKIIGTGKKL